jgi:transposase InsO family protein
MKYGFMKVHRSSWGVEEMACALTVSTSGYDGWVWRQEHKSDRQREEEQAVFEIRQIYEEIRQVYGSPRITPELRSRGIYWSENRVARVMRQYGIRSKEKWRFKITTHSKHPYPISADLLKRNFTVSGPNLVWVTDITYIWTAEGWLYLVTYLDLFSRKVVGWAMREYLGAVLVKEGLESAVTNRRPGEGLIIHSDRGSQYASTAFRNVLTYYTFKSSMGSTGDCYDNATAESFRHTLKTELKYFKKYETRAEARRDVFEYIEAFYNRKRLHGTLGYQSPAAFEAAAAAGPSN